MHIGEKIAFHRTQIGITQKELTKGICSTTYLSKLENNKIEINMETLSLLCERLHVDVEEILKDDYTSTLHQLRRVYTLLSKRQLDAAKPLIQSLNHLENSVNPMISTAYLIIQLEYDISMNNKDKSQEWKTELINRLNYLDPETQIWYYKTLGYYEYVFGNLELSSENFYQAHMYTTERGMVDPHLEYLLGLANTRLGLISRSNFHTERALENYTNQNYDIQKMIECKMLLAINYRKTGYYDKAETQYQMLIQLLKTEYKHPLLLGKTFHNLGYVYLVKEEDQEAIAMFLAALDYLDSLSEQSNSLYLLAYLYKKQGDTEQALQLCQRCMKLMEEPKREFAYKCYILKTSIETPDFNEPIFLDRLETEIIPYFIKQDPGAAKECLILLGDIYSQQSKYKQTAKFYLSALQLTATSPLKELLF